MLIFKSREFFCGTSCMSRGLSPLKIHPRGARWNLGVNFLYRMTKDKIVQHFGATVQDRCSLIGVSVALIRRELMDRMTSFCLAEWGHLGMAGYRLHYVMWGQAHPREWRLCDTCRATPPTPTQHVFYRYLRDNTGPQHLSVSAPTVSQSLQAGHFSLFLRWRVEVGFIKGFRL